VHYVDDEVEDEEGNEICVAEWVQKPGDKPISCSFLKPNGGRRDETKYTFDVSKCDRLIDLLLRGGVIWLTEGHVVPNGDILAKMAYCKWHASYTHTTNECNYFRWRVQSVINNGRLRLGDGGKMKLDMNLFPVGTVALEQKKILLCTDHAETTKGRNMVISNDLCNRMIKPHNPEVGIWKEDMQRKSARMVKPTSAMLIEKYQWQLEGDRSYRVAQGIKRDRFFEAWNRPDLPRSWCAWEPQMRIMEHAMDQAPGIRQITRFADRVGSNNPDRWVNHANVLHGGEGPSSCKQEQTEEHVVMVGSWPCKVSFEIHINGQRISYLVHEEKGKAVATG
jgi:hypothetical protein